MSSPAPETTASSAGLYGEQLRYDPEFHGPVKSRSCTDVICLFLFVSFIAGWIVVAYFAFRQGDPKVLIYPTDSDGNICGVDKYEDKPYLFFFDLRKCAVPSVIITGCMTPQVCVAHCPNNTFAVNDNFPEANKSQLICKNDVNKEGKTASQLVNSGDCASLYFKSSALKSSTVIENVPYASHVKDVLIGRCIPDIFTKALKGKYVKTDNNEDLVDENKDKVPVEQISNATAQLSQFLSVGEMGQKVFADFKVAWPYMIVALIFAMLISLLWIVLMRWIAAPMIWLSMILVLGLSLYGCYASTSKYIAMKEDPETDNKFRFTLNFKSYLAMRKTWLAFAIICGSVFAILLLVIIFLRNRIRIAIALIKQGSKAVANMPTTLAFPLLPYLLMLLCFSFWIAVSLYIAASGKASFVLTDVPPGETRMKNGTLCNPKQHINGTSGAKCLFQSYGVTDNIYTSHLYNTFGLFWGLFFAVGVGQVSLAGAFASYYWTRDKSRNVPTCAVGASSYRCIRYHLGSVAFGSLLIATVRMIRVMLEYIDQKAKKYDNPFTRCILCFCKCFFWCLENLLKFISKNAYIMIAIYGKNFCVSAKRAFFLLMRNILRVVVLDKLTDFLLFMGKLAVVAVVGAVSVFYFVTDQEYVRGRPDLNYKFLPPIVITFGAYIIASGFFSVYGMAVDTLFLCFLEDCERNDGSPEKPYFMSKELMRILHKRNKYREPETKGKGKNK